MHPHSTRKIIAAAVAIAAVATAALAGVSTAQAYPEYSTQPGRSAGPGSGTTAAAVHALRVRGEAMNARYAPNALALRALRIRGEALNVRYAVGLRSPDTVDAAAIAQAPVAASGGSPFGWDGFGVGAGIALALLLAALAARRVRGTRTAATA